MLQLTQLLRHGWCVLVDAGAAHLQLLVLAEPSFVQCRWCQAVKAGSSTSSCCQRCNRVSCFTGGLVRVLCG